jgi:5-methylthioribose kinase
MTDSSPSSLRSLIYDPSGPSLKVLDQLKVPAEKAYIDVTDIQTAWSVIRNMQIRGAPLIAIVASLGLAVDLVSPASTMDLDSMISMHGDRHGPVILSYIQGKIDYLETSRPTAVNLFNALSELRQALLHAHDETSTTKTSTDSPRERMVQAVMKHAEFMLERDMKDCQRIGQHGADEILRDAVNKVTILTICNTGALACSAYGTALGVVRAVRERGQLKSIIALETRPYNQGSRLTAFEIVEEDMPGGILICDSMAAALMKKGGVDAVVVGADRVCANGDTANKIGTYSLALVAAAHDVPVYVAAPFTTLDVSLTHGDQIVIEERPGDELISTSQAPASIAAWNPAFDVTPARYLAGIITEKGVIRPTVDGVLDVASFVARHQDEGASIEGVPADMIKLKVPHDYSEQSTKTLPSFLIKNAPKVMDILGTTCVDDLECVEVGDGNLNLVFIVANHKSGIKMIVKQSLPYVRCVGHSWPLTLERSFFEYKALVAEKEACPNFVPSVYYFSKSNGIIAMEYLAPPCIILRKGLIQGIRYPTMAADMGTFCAQTFFKTSGFRLSPTQLRQQVQFWSRNVEMCALTEQVVFTEPYMQADNNHWTTPQLDEDKKAIENDNVLKVAAAMWKAKFLSKTQSLIHADLHTGSVMCAPEPGKTYVIDPEFAFYGPMGFDTGAFVANLVLAYVSQPGHGNGDDYATWILEQIAVFWNTLVAQFVALWKDPLEHTGFLYGAETLESASYECQVAFFSDLLTDTLGFAGMKMLRRVVGIAHVEDLESIEDAEVRSQCERRAIEIAKKFIKSAESFRSIEEAIECARSQQ